MKDFFEGWKILVSKVLNFGYEILVFISAFFAPAAIVILAVFGAVLLDTYFGRWKSRSLKEEVTSKKTRDGLVPKVFQYTVAILVVFLLDEAIIDEFVSLFFDKITNVTTKIAGLVLAFIEFSSIDESWTAVKKKSIKESIREMFRSAKFLKKEVSDITSDKDE